MVVDYERAWVRLQELIASKSQHGREPTLKAMASIAAECQVPSGDLSRLLRLYGIEVERARAISVGIGRDEPEDFAGGDPSPADHELPEHHRPEGGHDGSGYRSEGRAVAA